MVGPYHFIANECSVYLVLQKNLAHYLFGSPCIFDAQAVLSVCTLLECFILVHLLQQWQNCVTRSGFRQRRTHTSP